MCLDKSKVDIMTLCSDVNSTQGKAVEHPIEIMQCMQTCLVTSLEDASGDLGEIDGCVYRGFATND